MTGSSVALMDIPAPLGKGDFRPTATELNDDSSKHLAASGNQPRVELRHFATQPDRAAVKKPTPQKCGRAARSVGGPPHACC